MKCPHCKSEIPDEASFCGECGKPIEVKEATKFCTNCGLEIPESANVCGECGFDLREKPKKIKEVKQKKVTIATKSTATIKKVSEPVKKEKPKTEKKVREPLTLPKWVLPAGIGLIAVLAIGAFFIFRPPEPAAKTTGLSTTSCLQGNWEGVVKGKDDTYELHITFDDECGLTSYCGNYFIPGYDFSGEVMVTKIVGNFNYLFFSFNEDTPEEQIPTRTLECLENGKLEYTSALEGVDTQTGILTKY